MDYRAANAAIARAAKADKLPSLEERFWSRVDKRGSNECWAWTGTRLPTGYGYLDMRASTGKLLSAHRYSVELHSGKPIPQGADVLHSCDNPSCVNPAHLSIGTRRENMQDMVRKGRQAGGMKNGRRKLDDTSVTAIRASSEPGAVLASRYGVNSREIWRIRTRRTWRSLP